MAPFKIYYSPASCGAASFIVASLGGLDFDSEIVDIYSHKTASGKDYYKVNPNGNVPCIAFPDGSILAQNASVLTFLADQAPQAGLVPKAGTICRYKYLDAIGFVNSEMHPAFGRLFSKSLSDCERAAQKKVAAAKARFFVEHVLSGDFVLGNEISAVDAYAYVVLSWAKIVDVNLSDIPCIAKYSARVKAVPGVLAAHEKMNSASS